MATLSTPVSTLSFPYTTTPVVIATKPSGNTTQTGTWL